MVYKRRQFAGRGFVVREIDKEYWGFSRYSEPDDVTYECDPNRFLGTTTGNKSDFSEVNGSRSETYSPTEFTAHMEFICTWDLRFSCMNALMKTVYQPPFPQIVADSDHAEMWAFNNLDTYYATYWPAVVTSVSITPLGAEGIQVDPLRNKPLVFQAHTKAKLSVDYKGLARCGNPTIQQTVTPSFEMRTLPAWDYYWYSDGAPVLDKESPRVQELKIAIQRQITGVRVIPPWFMGLAGCTNLNHWTDELTGNVYAAGTLLFIPSSMSRQLTLDRSDDDRLWDLSYELTYNPVGWNFFQRPHGLDFMMHFNRTSIGSATAGYMSAVKFFPYANFPSMSIDPDKVADQVYIGGPYTIHVVDDGGSGAVLGVNPCGEVTLLGFDHDD